MVIVCKSTNAQKAITIDCDKLFRHVPVGQFIDVVCDDCGKPAIRVTPLVGSDGRSIRMEILENHAESQIFL